MVLSRFKFGFEALRLSFGFARFEVTAILQ